MTVIAVAKESRPARRAILPSPRSVMAAALWPDDEGMAL